MNRRFSLATLLLVVTFSAIMAACIRAAVWHAWHTNGRELTLLLLLGALSGAIVGTALTLWVRGLTYAVFGAPILGACLGMAAMAQATMQVGWSLVLAGPIIVLGCVTVVAVAGKRGRRLRDDFGDESQFAASIDEVAAQQSPSGASSRS